MPIAPFESEIAKKLEIRQKIDEAREATKKRKGYTYVCGGAFRIRLDYSDYIKVERPKILPGRSAEAALAEFYRSNRVGESLGSKKYPSPCSAIIAPFYAIAFRGRFYVTIRRAKPKHLVSLNYKGADGVNHWIGVGHLEGGIADFNRQNKMVEGVESMVRNRRFKLAVSPSEKIPI